MSNRHHANPRRPALASASAGVGFTLLELMIVVIVIAILAILAVSSYQFANEGSAQRRQGLPDPGRAIHGAVLHDQLTYRDATDPPQDPSTICDAEVQKFYTVSFGCAGWDHLHRTGRTDRVPERSVAAAPVLDQAGTKGASGTGGVSVCW